MRVLLVHGYGLEGSGSSIYTRGLAYALLNAGHEVCVLAFRHRGDERAFEAFRMRGGEFAEMPVAALAVTYPRAEFEGARIVGDMATAELAHCVEQAASAVARCVSDSRPDLILTNHLLLSSAAAVGVARENGIPIVAVSHGTDIEYGAARSVHLARLARTIAVSATRCIALNETARRRAESVLELEEGTFSIVPPGIEAHHFLSVDETPRPPRVCQVGRLLLDKGQHVTIAAFCAVLSKTPSAELMIVGDGPDAAQFRDMVVALDGGAIAAAVRILHGMAGSEERARFVSPVVEFLSSRIGSEIVHSVQGRLADRVVFSGYRSGSDVSHILRHSRVLVLPSLVPECYPLTLLEAMSAGCCVSSTDLGGASDVLDFMTAANPVYGQHARVVANDPVRSLVRSTLAQISEWSSSQGTVMAAWVRSNNAWESVVPRLIAGAGGPQAEVINLGHGSLGHAQGPVA